MKIEVEGREEKPTLMIIPMIDIIFFLLVFFMISMLSMTEQRSVPLSLPRAASGEVSTVRNIPVTVTAEGDIYYEQDRMDIAALEQRLRGDQAEGKELSVILRGDTAAQYGRVVEVMDVVKRLGITRVYMATETKGA